jgi:NAD-dependent oxidoreductase involved in siderophore biosynthesis
VGVSLFKGLGRPLNDILFLHQPPNPRERERERERENRRRKNVRGFGAPIFNEKRKLTSKINSKCVLNVSTKITMRKINDTRIFVNKVETQLREKPLRGSQIQDIHYSEDKARYKIVTLTYTPCSGRTLLSNV